MKLVIVRHADPDYSIDSLTPTGWKEAELLSERLVKTPADAYYVSPLGRAKDTASLTLKKLGRTAETKEWLREFSEMERGAQDWLDQVVGHLDAPMTPDTPLRMAANGILLADLFNTVQLAASGAQISVTSLANDAAGLPQTVRRRDILNAYPYTNTLTVLQITGAVLRRAMERSAEYFTRRADGMLDISDAFLKPKVEHYNYDYYAGVHYVFDCSRPVGSRVTELSVNGRPVADGDIFTACLSSYRASGTGGYDCYVGCPVLREIGTEMSDLLLDFFKAHDQKLPITHCEFRVI